MMKKKKRTRKSASKRCSSKFSFSCAGADFEGGRRLSGDDFCFFFQAEDGIRDKLVTGVQTCALPICARLGRLDLDGGQHRGLRVAKHVSIRAVVVHMERARSEERRVGKECRSRWSPYDEKKKTNAEKR